MKNKIKPLFASFLLMSSSAVLADQMSVPSAPAAVPIGQQGIAYANEARPRSGMSMNQVSNQFGAPGQKVSAVGEPPISRWVYDHYTVYFEQDRVIHSVLHRN